MASLGVEPDELKTIEQLRQKLGLLAQNIQSLRNDIAHSNPVPTALVCLDGQDTIFLI